MGDFMETKKKLALPDLKSVCIDDFFWNKYTALVTKEIIPYQWSALNDEIADAESSHCIRNFEIAAGRKTGEFKGAVFQDTDVAKWLEAVAYSLSYEKDEALEKTADEVITLIGEAQQPDGYLDTFFTIAEPDHKFTNLREGHELYTAGHMMEAAVAYYKTTGKSHFLDIMKKNADLLCEVFHRKEYEHAVPGHEEIEIGLIKLYEVTGEKKYMELAKEFVDRRGCEPNYLITEHEHENWIDIFKDVNPFNPEYSQCHEPVRMQKKATGHAVRAVYLYCAMADLAYAYQDESLMKACETLYENIVDRQMYITGGIGSSGAYERFTTDYDLPNDMGYAESCASIGLALFCRRMAQITRDSKYVETMECALMNTVLAGIAMDGKSFFYVNVLEVWPDRCINRTSMDHVKPVRQKWFGCACCPPNIARTLASLGEYICFTEKDSLWLNLYVSSRIHTTWQKEAVEVSIETKMPFDGETRICVDAAKAVDGTLLLRIPEYAKQVEVFQDGKQLTVTTEKGYLEIKISGRHSELLVNFDMPAHFVYANPQVRADVGKAAIVKGPLVYCIEEVDNGANLAECYVDTESALVEKMEEDLLKGTIAVTAKGWRLVNPAWDEHKLYGSQKPVKEQINLKFVPYCYWGNRQTGEMRVWVNI